jgi:hypothetical protein
MTAIRSNAIRALEATQDIRAIYGGYAAGLANGPISKYMLGKSAGN